VGTPPAKRLPSTRQPTRHEEHQPPTHQKTDLTRSRQPTINLRKKKFPRLQVTCYNQLSQTPNNGSANPTNNTTKPTGNTGNNPDTSTTYAAIKEVTTLHTILANRAWRELNKLPKRKQN